MEISYITENDLEVRGIIVALTRTYIEIKITWPYCNYANSIVSTGPGSIHTNYLETYPERALELLKESYKRMRYLDENIDRICLGYIKLKKHLQEILKLENEEVRKDITYCLNADFFETHWFIVPMMDKDFYKKVLEIYLTENKRKIYLPISSN